MRIQNSKLKIQNCIFGLADYLHPRLKKKTQKEALEVFEVLKKEYPDPKTELFYEDPFQLLIAVILSAQCTDAQVNKTTPALFKKYPTAQKMAKAPIADLEKLIHSCGFYRNKAKSILSASQDLVEKFKGKVPSSLEELVQLAGVGRKTASVVLNQAFDEPAIAVDTHVARVSARLGWVKTKTAEKIELELRELLPQTLWAAVNGTLILHGRKLCKAQRPLCTECPVNKLCPSAFKFPNFG